MREPHKLALLFLSIALANYLQTVVNVTKMNRCAI
jgi:hypothetical protein